jgi:hypothetical protein
LPTKMSIVVVSPTRGEPGWVMAIAGEPAPDPPRRLRRAPAPALNRGSLAPTQPALREPIEVHLVERGHHEVGGGAQELGIIGPRDAERRHLARLGGLDARGGGLDDESLPRTETQLLRGGQEGLRCGLPCRFAE